MSVQKEVVLQIMRISDTDTLTSSLNSLQAPMAYVN